MSSENKRLGRSVASALLLLVLAVFFVHAADETIIVGRGQGGNAAIVNIRNNSESLGPMEGVRVSVLEVPDFVSATPIVQPQTAAVAVGSVQPFQMQFNINPDRDGAVGFLSYRVTVDNPNSYPKTKDFVVELKVDGMAPKITFLDSYKLASTGVTKDDAVQITADDRLSQAGVPSQGVSGIAKIEVFNGTPTPANLLGSNTTKFNEWHTYSLANFGLTTLPAGTITVVATDQAGNSTTSTFKVDRTAPILVLTNNEGVIVNPGALTDSAIVIAGCSDAVGLEEISILTSTGGVFRGPINFGDDPTQVEMPFVDIPDNQGGESYFVKLVDLANNQAIQEFRVKRAPFVSVTMTPNQEFDYVFEYYGASVQTFSIPYAQTNFFFKDALGISSFELKKNGVTIVSHPYADALTGNESMVLDDGVYSFFVYTSRGQTTSGIFTKYTSVVTPRLSRADAVVRREGEEFKVNFPVSCTSNGPPNTGASAVTIRPVALVNGEHVYQPPLASLACSTGRFDGHLADGLYAVTGLDHGYEVDSFFRIDTIPTVLQAYSGSVEQNPVLVDIAVGAGADTLVLRSDADHIYPVSGTLLLS